MGWSLDGYTEKVSLNIFDDTIQCLHDGCYGNNDHSFRIIG